MITAAIRRGLLANFPFGTPVAIVAPDGVFTGLAAERNDPATSLHALQLEPALRAAAPHVILEGLDAVEDPVALLAHVRGAAPQARLFALVANGAHLPALAAYFGGAAIAAVRPLVRNEVERALAAAGWHPIAIEAIADEPTFAAAALPAAVPIGALTFALDDAATLERVRPAAFLAIADPQ